MLLTGYTKSIFRPRCNTQFESVHCIAQLNEDISEVLPYLNAMLGGTEYYTDPPAVMFLHYGKIIKVGGKEIAINALEDENEAERVLLWLKDQINEAWERRESITPKFIGRKKPQPLEILKLLPRTNCRKCGRPTCMVFAMQMIEGGLAPSDCPELKEENIHMLHKYLSKYEFD